jgi:hypothetical protein
MGGSKAHQGNVGGVQPAGFTPVVGANASSAHQAPTAEEVVTDTMPEQATLPEATVPSDTSDSNRDAAHEIIMHEFDKAQTLIEQELGGLLQLTETIGGREGDPTNSVTSEEKYVLTSALDTLRHTNDPRVVTNTLHEATARITSIQHRAEQAAVDATNDAGNVFQEAADIIEGVPHTIGDWFGEHVEGPIEGAAGTVQKTFQTTWADANPISGLRSNIKRDLKIVAVGAGILLYLLWKGSAGARSTAKRFVSDNVQALSEGTQDVLRQAPKALATAAVVL